MTTPIGSSDGEREALPPLPTPVAEFHEPETDFEDGTWQPPHGQGWTGGVFVYTAEQMQEYARAALSSDREMAPEAKADSKCEVCGEEFDPEVAAASNIDSPDPTRICSRTCADIKAKPSTDEAVAIEFYRLNPSAALLDFRARINAPLASSAHKGS